MEKRQKPVRILIVDDSATIRTVLARALSAGGQIEVVGTARDGIDACEQVARLHPDVVTLDVEMPRMDGLAALRQIMATAPVPVIMVSSLTKTGADMTLRALELGAVDFVAKPLHAGVPAIHDILDELNEKILAVAGRRLRRLSEPERRAPARASGGWLRRAVVIGASTGGPKALMSVLTALPGDLDAPVFVVQHMPPGFTRTLAERIEQLSPLRVEEARPGSRAERRKVFVAPGGFHMLLSANGEIRLEQSAPECGVRPSVNVTMESVTAAWGSATLGVILTGMGNDGTRGARIIRAAGGQVLAEHESTCAVYGMPKSVIDAGLADAIAPLQDMAGAIVDHCRTGSRMERSA